MTTPPAVRRLRTVDSFSTSPRSRDQSGFQPIHLDGLHELLADIGEPVYVFGSTAAALHHFDGFKLKPPFHVVVPRGRNIVRIGHVVHTSEHLPAIDCEEAYGFPVLSPTRTLIDLAVDTRQDRLTAALDGSIRDLLVIERFLHERITDLRSRGRYGIPRLLAAVEGSEVTRGGHSWLEREYLRLMATTALPLPTAQQVRSRRGDKLIRVDFHFLDTPVVVEVLGYRWHRTTAQMAIDAARMNQLVLSGHVPMQFTYTQVVSDPRMVVTDTTAAVLPFLRRGYASPHKVTQRL
jgi:hypothetical protein